MRRTTPPAVLAVIAAVVAGCGLLPSPPPHAYDIHVLNGTALDVAIVVEGRQLRVVPGGESATIPAAEAGPLPWTVVGRTASGRILVSFPVAPGEIDVDGREQRGRFGRADLSCGRLDVYVGPPVMGPAPGPGVPGDCVP